MSQTPVPRRTPPATPVLGGYAARVLTQEVSRLAGPKAVLVVSAGEDSAVPAAALARLSPGDTLTLVNTTGSAAPDGSRWPADSASAGTTTDPDSPVRVVTDVSAADPADVVIVAEPLTGSASAVRAQLDDLAKQVAEGGVLCVTVAAGPGVVDGAAEELERQQAIYGVGTDLVLRNLPPVRVHRLRFSAAPLTVLSRLRPVPRPSSVPLTGRMRLDSNGVAAFGIAAGLAVAARLTRPRSRLWLLPALAAAPVAAFFRDPERFGPDDEQAVLAASDGKVLSVERLRDQRFGELEFVRVAVFLSVLDVHVNRSPVAGRVADVFVEDGGFAAAMTAAAEHNVAAYTVLETERGRVVVAQRTGLVARRIVHRAPAGAVLARGERFGLIRFGSRTDVYLPADRADATVAPGERVLGGQTVIARWR